MAVQPSPAGHASTIAGMIAMRTRCLDGRNLQLSFFLPLFRETLCTWGIGECDVEPPFAWGLGKRRVTTSAKRAMRVRGNASGRVLSLTRLVLSESVSVGLFRGR